MQVQPLEFPRHAATPKPERKFPAVQVRVSGALLGDRFQFGAQVRSPTHRRAMAEVYLCEIALARPRPPCAARRVERGLRRHRIADRRSPGSSSPALMQAARLKRAKASLMRHSLRCSAMASSQRAGLAEVVELGRSLPRDDAGRARPSSRGRRSASPPPGYGRTRRTPGCCRRSGS